MHGLHELREEILLNKFDYVKGEIDRITFKERQYFSSIIFEIEDLHSFFHIYIKTSVTTHIGYSKMRWGDMNTLHM